MIERVTEIFYGYSVNMMAKIVVDKEKYCVGILWDHCMTTLNQGVGHNKSK